MSSRTELLLRLVCADCAGKGLVKAFGAILGNCPTCEGGGVTERWVALADILGPEAAHRVTGSLFPHLNTPSHATPSL